MSKYYLDCLPEKSVCFFCFVFKYDGYTEKKTLTTYCGGPVKWDWYVLSSDSGNHSMKDSIKYQEILNENLTASVKKLQLDHLYLGYQYFWSWCGLVHKPNICGTCLQKQMPKGFDGMKWALHVFFFLILISIYSTKETKLKNPLGVKIYLKIYFVGFTHVW